MAGIGIAACAGTGCECVAEECDACTCSPTSLGFWMQYSQVAVGCYTCDECDPDPFQVILTETAAFSAGDIADESHPDCTIDESQEDNAKAWLLERDCIEKYYTGGFDTGCKVCEFIEDPGICDPDPLLPAFFSTRAVSYYYATLAGEGALCSIRVIRYTQYWTGEGSTAIEACENLCLSFVVFDGSMQVATGGDCCDYHDLDAHTGPTAESWACGTCEGGPLSAICLASLAIAPPPPPGDPKYGTLEFICV